MRVAMVRLRPASWFPVQHIFLEIWDDESLEGFYKPSLDLLFFLIDGI